MKWQLEETTHSSYKKLSVLFLGINEFNQALNSVLWDILVCMAVGDTYHILLSIKNQFNDHIIDYLKDICLKI